MQPSFPSYITVSGTKFQLHYNITITLNSMQQADELYSEIQRSKIHLLQCTLSRQGHRKGAQVHGAHQAASHIPALNHPSHSWYSFTDHERMGAKRNWPTVATQLPAASGTRTPTSRSLVEHADH